MKIAIVGDSTSELYYLIADRNPALLSAPHNKPAGYDFSMVGSLPQYLNDTHTIGTFARGGMDSSECLSVVVPYTAGVYGSPITISATMWDAAVTWAPDLIVFCFGINDSTAITLEQYAANLDTMFSDAAARGIDVVGWNGLYFAYGPTGEWGESRRTAIFPYFDTLTAKCAEYGFRCADTRSAHLAAIAEGVWDVFSHNDETYLASWENGSTVGTSAYYSNVHQWIAGQEIVASTIAEMIDYGPYDLDVTLTYPYDLDVTLVAPPATFRPRRQRMAALGGF